MQFQNVDIRMSNSKYDKKHKLSFTYIEVQIPFNNNLNKPPYIKINR